MFEFPAASTELEYHGAALTAERLMCKSIVTGCHFNSKEPSRSSLRNNEQVLRGEGLTNKPAYLTVDNWERVSYNN